MRGRTLIWLWLVAVALVGCHNSTPSEEMCPEASPHSELAAIDTLIQSRPDSALAMLLDTSFDEPYYQLLLSEALYKNDYQQANRTELLSAMAYYDSLSGRDGVYTVSTNDAFLAARCHYMNGVGYYEMDSVVPACAEYLKALEIMDEHFKEKDLVGHKAKFMALTHTHLCGLFSDQYLHEQAICFGKKALFYYNRYDAEPWHIAWLLDKLGNHYDMMEQVDSAEYYYDEAIKVLPDTNNLLFRDIISVKSFLSYNKEKNTYIAIKQLHSILTQAESENEYLSRCLIIGEIYYHEKMWDSAWCYLNDVFNTTDRRDPKILSAQYLQNICLERGDTLSSRNYMLYLSQQANTSDTKSLLHSKLTELFRLFEQNKKNDYYKKQNNDLLIRTISIIVFFLVVAASLIVVLIINRKRRKQMKQQKEATEKKLEEERRNHTIQQAALSGKLKKSNQSLRETTEQLEKFKTLQNMAFHKAEATSDLNAFKAAPICRDILEVVEKMNFKPKIDCIIYKDCALDNNQIQALLDAANSHLEQFTIRLRKTYPALTEEDTKYCCLYLLGLNEADIAALMQRAYSTVCERNRKIKRIMKANGELSVALYDMV